MIMKAYMTLRVKHVFRDGEKEGNLNVLCFSLHVQGLRNKVNLLRN